MVFFTSIPVGSYDITVTKVSFLPQVRHVIIKEDEVSTLDVVLVAGEPNLEVSDSLLEVRYLAGHEMITVTANATWQVDNDCPWLECSQQSGIGNAKLTLTWTENAGAVKPTGSLLIKSGSIEKKVKVIQDFPLKLLEVHGYVGNGMEGIVDSIYLHFNRPVTVNHIINDWHTCLCEIHYRMVEGRKGVIFSYACGKLGGLFPV